MNRIRSGAALAVLLTEISAGALAMTAVGPETESGRKWAENAFFPRMEALTGVTVTGQEQDSETWRKTRQMLEAGQADADILFKAGLSRSEEQKLLDAGSIIDLSGLIQENMPNLSALLAAHPEWKQAITLPDGRIASLPALNEEPRQVCVFLNSTWLQTLSLFMPQSIEELTAALQAFRTGDPNGNGLNDERALDITGVWELRWLLPYFGIAADDWNLTRLADGTLGFAPEQDGYYEFIETMAGWYASGLLDSKTFTATHAESALNTSSASSSSQEEKATSGLLVSLNPVSHVPVSAVTEYSALLMPYNGKTVWRDMLGGVSGGCMAVTNACRDPAAALRWADALYGTEAMVLAYAGEEGTDWQKNDQGQWNFLVNDFRTVEDIRNESIIYTGTEMPGLYPAAFLRQVDSGADQWLFDQSERVRAVSSVVTAPYLLSGEAAARSAVLQEKLCRMVDEGIARFATGEIPLTRESYAAFLSDLQAAGSGELVSLFNAAEAAR